MKLQNHKCLATGRSYVGFKASPKSRCAILNTPSVFLIFIYQIVVFKTRPKSRCAILNTPSVFLIFIYQIVVFKTRPKSRYSILNTPSVFFYLVLFLQSLETRVPLMQLYCENTHKMIIEVNAKYCVWQHRPFISFFCDRTSNWITLIDNHCLAGVVLRVIGWR